MTLRNHPHLYEINTRPWLNAIGRRESRTLTLAQVPDREWDRLAGYGVDIVYLMGLWRRSAFGRQVARSEPSLFADYDGALPDWQLRDVIGSAYSVTAYEPDPQIGTWSDLAATREKLRARGMRLIVDFVPNHTAFDHPWITQFPERYVQGSEDAFRRNPSAFRAIESGTGELRVIACGRDPFFPPWTDVAQLDYFNPATRAAMMIVLQKLAEHADGARCDMAMLALTDVFGGTWSGLVAEKPATEFWADARAAVPGFALIAEVYWDLEWRLQQLGFDFTYDKRLYDRLLHSSAREVYGHLHADVDYQRRSARFIENHDERRSAAAFGDRVRPAAVVMSTLPGLRFFQDGQFEGHRTRLPVQLGRLPEEATDAGLLAFYERLLAAVDHPAFHDGNWELCEITAVDYSSHQLVAWEWRLQNEWRVVVVNLGSGGAQGHVRIATQSLRAETIVFEDLLDGQQYSRQRADIDSGGLYVGLDPGRAHVFKILASECDDLG